MSDFVDCIISCPGKVILHGEHSVVYGKPALATAIGIRTKLFLKQNSSKLICIDFVDIHVKISLELDNFNKLLQNIEKSISGAVSDEEKDKKMLDQVRTFIEQNFKYENSNTIKTNALLSTFFLIIKIYFSVKISEIESGFNIILKSDIQIGAGLGSSASFGVCLATCFLILCRQISPAQFPNIVKDFGMTISNWAFESEKIMHGKPSGVDNTVCTFGNIIKFQHGKAFEKIDIKVKLPMLLVDSKVSRNTANLVKHFSELKKELPALMDHILNAMGELVESAVSSYQNYIENDDVKFKNIERFVQINNDLLRACNVSHKRLEDIFSTALKYDFSCKLTGAGGGGFVIIILPENYKSQERFLLLCNELKSKNFDYIETVMGESGVTVEIN